MRKLQKHGSHLLCVISICGLLIATWAAVGRHAFGWEITLFRSINNWPESWRLFFTGATQLGNYMALFITTIVALLYKKPRLALRLFGNGSLAFLLTDMYLKQVVQRGRPVYLLQGVHLREFQPSHYGFPSGHTAVATAIAITLWPLLPTKWRWLMIVWIGLVGLSRLYLGVHLPLDVIGGTLTGLFIVSGTKLIHGKLKSVMKITGLKLTN